MANYLLSVDPATGGGESKPAFALWDMAWKNRLGSYQPRLVDCGTVKPQGGTHWKRMRSLGLLLPAAIINTFDGNTSALDQCHLVVEGLPPTLSGLGGRSSFSNAGSIHLHHSAAVICTCWDWPSVCELAVQTWKSFLRAMELDQWYIKTDTNDAIIIGLTHLCVAGLECPEIPKVILVQMFGEKHAHLSRLAWSKWSEHINASRKKSAAASERKKASDKAKKKKETK